MFGWHILDSERLALVLPKPLFIIVKTHQNKTWFFVLRNRDRSVCRCIENIAKRLLTQRHIGGRSGRGQNSTLPEQAPTMSFCIRH